MLKRYGEVTERLAELGTRAGTLNNIDRHEMQTLLEEQAWLSSTMIKKGKSLLEEIDNSFEKLFDWMVDISCIIDRADCAEGSPQDLMILADSMDEVSRLNEQLKKMHLNHEITLKDQERKKGKEEQYLALAASQEAAATAEPESAPNNAKADDTDVLPEKWAENTGKKPPKWNKGRNKKKSARYQPPPELLNSIAEKVSPKTKGDGSIIF